MNKEETIISYMKNLQISREEAEQLYEDDAEDFIGEEGEEMQEKAKAVRRYEQTAETKKRKPRERKVDNDKAELLKIFGDTLTDINIEYTMETETKLHFKYGGNEYTLMLTKHRPKKGS